MQGYTTAWVNMTAPTAAASAQLLPRDATRIPGFDAVSCTQYAAAVAAGGAGWGGRLSRS